MNRQDAKDAKFFYGLYTAAHKTEISHLNGIGRRMPWTMGVFAVGSLSMIGLPPAAGEHRWRWPGR